MSGLVNGYDYTCRVKTTTSVGSSAWSAPSNMITPAGFGMPPTTPTIISVTAGDKAITVNFTNSAGATAFVASCGGFTATASASPITVTGLTNLTSYTCKVKAVNGAGASSWSAASNAVIPYEASMLPLAPTIGTATALDGAVRVAFTPAALAYGTLINHTADCGGKTATGTSSPITVTGVPNDTPTTCKVRTTSTIGTGPWSAPSNTVMPVETAVVYFHNDISGSPMLATDASGAVLWKENYRPYGERLNNQASGTAAQTGFTGKPFDAATGLSYMGARYYNPMLGRFMGMDPVDFKEDNIHSFNRYAYANNNPYKFVDRNGKYAELIVEAMSLTVGYMSLKENLRAGNTGAALADGLGMLADIAGAALPGVPGVAGLGIKASREAAGVGASVASKADAVIAETLAGKGNLTSAHKLSASELLTAGEKFLGSGYKEIGKPGSGVFRSADGNRQFRIDGNSLSGSHAPGVPHGHLETYSPGAAKPTTNNHIPFSD